MTMTLIVTGVTAFAGVAVADDGDAGVVDLGGDDEDDVQEERDDVDGALAELEEDVRIQEIEYNESAERLSIVVHNRGDSSETIHAIEVLDPETGGWQWTEIRLRPDETTEIVLEGIPNRNGEPAALVATDSSLDAENVVWVRTGDLPEPETSTTWQTLLLGIGVTTLGTVAVAWSRYHRIGDGPEDMEAEL
ncbi:MULTISPECIES: hypothetical protein [Streptomyces]|uniref:hypothetical protein n=2 Tax=Streptomyces TaxID=1883 RepID=UPI0031F8C5F6